MWLSITTSPLHRSGSLTASCPLTASCSLPASYLLIASYPLVGSWSLPASYSLRASCRLASWNSQFAPWGATYGLPKRCSTLGCRTGNATLSSPYAPALDAVVMGRSMELEAVVADTPSVAADTLRTTSLLCEAAEFVASVVELAAIDRK